MILEVCWDGLSTLSCGLSQSHGHGSWLVCEVALRNNQLEVQDSIRITHHYRGIYETYLKLVKKNRKITTCNRLDLETILGF